MSSSAQENLPLELPGGETAPQHESNQRGFRLSKLEVFNWGTFDREVHSFAPRGASSLLVGENGSGKSTLVDAMLTLLVRPGVRNYNVAAGATKKERDERTYMRGAYDRTAGRDEKPQIQYLRDGSGFYSVLLAAFASATSGQTFTICQVMYLTSAGDKRIVYGFDDTERSIAGDLGHLPSGGEIKSMMVDRGFRVTESYKQYFSWMKRVVGFRPKAMDVFNQTVAVKDVQRLDEFIRSHMLEKKPWNDKVSGLLKHFAELSEAHRALVQVRQQSELLQPIMRAGERYRTTAEKLNAAREQQSAAALYFDAAMQDLLRPLCDQWRLRVEHLAQQILVLDENLTTRRDDVARLKQDIANSGGVRLQRLPDLIDQQEQLALAKRDKRLTLEAKLRHAGIEVPLNSAEQLEKAHVKISARIEALTCKRESDRSELSAKQYELGAMQQAIEQDRIEAESLRRRKGNLPESFIEIRDSLCRALGLSPTDLPFAAELIAVDLEHRRWEGSIEQVLHSFARTLLVPDDLYARVSGYVDGKRLVDGGGKGGRLTYNRVGTPADVQKMPAAELSLPDMLQYRNDHPLAPYVRAEVQSRFDHIACDSVEQFQMAAQRAMTTHRHVKQNWWRHAKDDRGRPDDRRNFVLGWDNKTKRIALEESIKDQEQTIQRMQAKVNVLQTATEQAATILSVLDDVQTVTDFDSIDDHRHEYEASQLRLEKQQLETSNDQIKQLKAKLAELAAEVAGLQADRDDTAKERTLTEKQLQESERVLIRVTEKLDKAKAAGSLDIARRVFDSIESILGTRQLTIENMMMLPSDVGQEISASIQSLEKRLEPIRDTLTKAMSKLLTKFPVFESELDPTPQSLSSFEQLHERIAKDDLPRHERRFKQRLKDKVLQEIGLLHGSLETEREEIRSKIELLNEALRRLDWRPGTYMRLEPSDTSDAEIRDFRRELAGCLEGTLDGTAEANEATFLRIEKLVSRLRDDANLRWREKVIDVRNWFNFAAREFDSASGEAGSYYDGGTGQSGGEKGKLAFLVLVAAIAYQYDLRPDEPDSDRFHFVMVDEMFSRSDDARAKYALNLFDRFGLQLAIVAPLDAKARVTESHVGMYGHIVKDPQTNRSELISLTARQYRAIQQEEA